MKTHRGIVLILFLALLPLEMRAQESEPESPVVWPMEPPVTLNGQRPSPALNSERTRDSYLSGGIALVGVFTDNALFSSTDKISNVSYLVEPHLKFAHSAPRANWSVSLGAALFNHQISGENQAAESLQLDLTYRLTQYVNLRASSDVSNTNGFFSALNPSTSGSGIGVVEQATNSLLVPLTQQTISTSNLAELNYQFGPHSIVGARGTYSTLDYPGSSMNAQFGSLYNDRTYSGEVFYNYQISARQWVGITLRTQKFETQPFLAGTKTDSGLLFYALNVTPNVTLSFFGGPEWFETPRISDATTVVGLIRGWTPAEGATFIWQRDHTSVVAEFSRQLSNGGGLSSAVIDQNANAQLRRQLSSTQELNFGFTYAKYDPFESGQSFRDLTGQFHFQQRLGKRLIALVGYAREQQETPNSRRTAAANLVWVSVSYDFSRTLGR
jgi:hypothetical protein